MPRKQKRRLEKIDDFHLCTEVTFDVFEKRFIARYHRLMSGKLSKKMSPIFIWTEIMSVIKGSKTDKALFQQRLSQHEYELLGSKTLTRKEKSTLYFVYLKYEEWKLNVRAFDFLDVVNHVMSQTLYQERSKRDRFDYLIIDEVQDLYPKTVQLLLKQTKYKVVFAGDSAQTIASGVNVRISEMSKAIDSGGKQKTV